MATDLSKLLKETLLNTLNLNLSKDIDISQSFLACNEDIKDLNLLEINSIFTFESLSSQVKFLFPAYTASYIFNTLMMEEGEPLLEVDDDIADAVKEVSAQTSGSLELAINGMDMGDLGACKFSVDGFNLINQNEYEITKNVILLKIIIEEKNYDLFIQFDDNNTQFFEELIASPEVPREEKSVEDENTKEDESQEDDSSEVSLEEKPITDTNEDSPTDDSSEVSEENEKKTSTDEENTSKEDESKPDEESNNDDEVINPLDAKNKKIKLIIMILGGFIVVLLTTFTVMLFMGVFDPAPIAVVKDKNIIKKSSDDIILPNAVNKEITYKNDMINQRRLNARLSYLTKYEILDEDVVTRFKFQEKERLHQLKMQRLENFASNNKEEELFKDSLPKDKRNDDRFLNKDINKTIEKITQERLIFIKIAPLKYKKYKDIINNEKRENTKISICKDKKSKTQVYVGPIYLELIANKLILQISPKSKKIKDAKIVLMTTNEFDKLCDF